MTNPTRLPCVIWLGGVRHFRRRDNGRHRCCTPSAASSTIRTELPQKAHPVPPSGDSMYRKRSLRKPTGRNRKLSSERRRTCTTRHTGELCLRCCQSMLTNRRCRRRGLRCSVLPPVGSTVAERNERRRRTTASQWRDRSVRPNAAAPRDTTPVCCRPRRTFPGNERTGRSSIAAAETDGRRRRSPADRRQRVEEQEGAAGAAS